MASCIFCNEEFGPSRKRSREHVFPEWVEDVIPRYGKTIKSTVWNNEGKLEQRGHGTKLATIVVRQVCVPCNNGWMSRLEEKAKPVLSGPISGRRGAMHKESQATVAGWAAKTTMLASVAMRDALAPITLDEYAWMRERQEPPVGWQIVVAAYSGRLLSGQVTQRGLVRTKNHNVSNMPEAHITTIVVGHFVVQVFGCQGEDFAVLKPGRQIVRAVKRLWPYESSFSWPPRMLLDDEGLDRFAGIEIHPARQ